LAISDSTHPESLAGDKPKLIKSKCLATPLPQLPQGRNLSLTCSYLARLASSVLSSANASLPVCQPASLNHLQGGQLSTTPRGVCGQCSSTWHKNPRLQRACSPPSNLCSRVIFIPNQSFLSPRDYLSDWFRSRFQPHGSVPIWTTGLRSRTCDITVGIRRPAHSSVHPSRRIRAMKPRSHQSVARRFWLTTSPKLYSMQPRIRTIIIRVDQTMFGKCLVFPGSSSLPTRNYRGQRGTPSTQCRIGVARHADTRMWKSSDSRLRYHNQ
jgi:hypothetical protein